MCEWGFGSCKSYIGFHPHLVTLSPSFLLFRIAHNGFFGLSRITPRAPPLAATLISTLGNHGRLGATTASELQQAQQADGGTKAAPAPIASLSIQNVSTY